MKFIHTGDIHYGLAIEGSAGSDRSGRALLERIISECNIRHIDLLLIAGNLFDRQPTTKELDEVASILSSAKATNVVITAGTSDYISKSSAVRTYRWPSNVYYANGSSLLNISFDNIRTSICGISYDNAKKCNIDISNIKPRNDGYNHILLVNCSDDEVIPSHDTNASDIGWQYIALSRPGKPDMDIHRDIAICGSPIPLSIKDSGDHGVICVEMDESSHQIKSLELIQVASATYIPLVVNVTPESSSDAIISQLRHSFIKYGPDNIYRIKITGKINPDIHIDLSVLKEEFNIAQIIDETEPQYDFHKLFKEHSNDMIGFFVRDMDTSDASPLEKKALYYGIDALIKTEAGGNLS